MHKRVRWWAALGGAFVGEVILVIAAVAWVAIYSYGIHTGETADFYQRYAQRASPWVSLIGGFPVFYLVCRWIGSRFPENAWPTAMGVFGISLAVMLVLLLLGGDNPGLPVWLLAANYLSKLLACHLGGRSAERKR